MCCLFFLKFKLRVCIFRSISSRNGSFPKILWGREVCWSDRFFANRIFLGECCIFIAVMLLQKLVLAESLLSSAMECIWMGMFSWSLWKK